MGNILVGLVTYLEDPGLTTSDKLLQSELIALGTDARTVSWDNDSINWRAFDALALRSCWDYHLRPNEFTEWLNELEKAQINILNSYELVYWNIHKSYLLDLQSKSVEIVPTKLIKMGSEVDTSSIKDWEEIVIKPAVGASAYKITSGLSNDPEILSFIRNLLEKTDVLIQPLMKESLEAGEFSSVFFSNVYSHTVLKRPKKGDFRSNYEQGGSADLVSQNKEVIGLLSPILAKLQTVPLYARVDYLLRGNKPVLMELELI